MKKSININGNTIGYYINKSIRARRISISVETDSLVKITMPQRSSVKSAERFLLKNKLWILKRVQYNKKHISYIDIKDKPYHLYKARARLFIVKTTEYYAKEYGFKYKKITIKNQQQRWGSCSENSILNFNYKLYFLPLHLAEYIIVHELCHLQELNHSQRFWDLVGTIIPDYKKCERELRKVGFK